MVSTFSRPTPSELSELGDAHGPSTPSTTCSSRGISTPSTCSSSPGESQVSHYSDIPVLPLPGILEETGRRIMRHNIGQHEKSLLRAASMLPAEDKARLSISCKLFQEHLNSNQWWSVDEVELVAATSSSMEDTNVDNKENEARSQDMTDVAALGVDARRRIWSPRTQSAASSGSSGTVNVPNIVASRQPLGEVEHALVEADADEAEISNLYVEIESDADDVEPHLWSENLAGKLEQRIRENAGGWYDFEIYLDP